jgi:hypothetical protein
MGFLLVSLLGLVGFMHCKLLIYKGYFWGLTLPLECGIIAGVEIEEMLN